MLNKVFVFLFFLFSLTVFSQDEAIVLNTESGKLFGTLKIPTQKNDLTLVILHSGSGPTDRNGNQEDLQSNSMKYISDILAAENIASLRFDKRGVAESKAALADESEITIDVYINDLKSWIELVSKDKRFRKIIIAGHSEGSLIGMEASIENKKVKGFVSIAGAGRAADVVIKEQLEKAPPEIKNSVFEMMDKVKKGDTVENVPPIFYMILRPSIQPYMRSWFKYDPAVEIKKLKIPVLIVQGTTDIQVKESDAKLLSEAKPEASLKLIKNMNHPLKECESTEKAEQEKYYADPAFPLHKEFVSSLLQFVKGIK
jgi:pimeloyl-ACP methyl ester carboxylesterase